MTVRKNLIGGIDCLWPAVRPPETPRHGEIVEAARRAVSTVSPCPPCLRGYFFAQSCVSRRSRAVLLRAAILLLVLTGLPAAYADSAASKNKQGNRLFQEGKYEDAQKAYVEAHAQAPDKPEILYNVGNSLIKQKKYDQALQSLRQAVAKADRGLQASGWYNSGNALYEAGNYQDAAQAYIQALRSNPSDRDAKHNLELALRKKQEQQNQQNPKQNQDKKDQQTGGGQNDQAGDKNQKRTGAKAHSARNARCRSWTRFKIRNWRNSASCSSAAPGARRQAKTGSMIRSIAT